MERASKGGVSDSGGVAAAGRVSRGGGGDGDGIAAAVCDPARPARVLARSGRQRGRCGRGGGGRAGGPPRARNDGSALRKARNWQQLKAPSANTHMLPPSATSSSCAAMAAASQDGGALGPSAATVCAACAPAAAASAQRAAAADIGSLARPPSLSVAG